MADHRCVGRGVRTRCANDQIYRLPVLCAGTCRFQTYVGAILACAPVGVRERFSTCRTHRPAASNVDVASSYAGDAVAAWGCAQGKGDSTQILRGCRGIGVLAGENDREGISGGGENGGATDVVVASGEGHGRSVRESTTGKQCKRRKGESPVQHFFSFPRITASATTDAARDF